MGLVKKDPGGINMSIEVKNEYGKIDITNDVITQWLGRRLSNVMGLSEWLQGIRSEGWPY